MAYDAGDPLLVTWCLWWNTQAVPFTERWWNAPIFYPMPGAFALSEHMFGIALFTTPLQLAGLNPVGAYNIAMIASGWMSGFFAFLLARRLTGSVLAGLVAGVAFAIAPYRAAHLSHLQVLTAQWMPLALLAMHAYLDERRARWLALFACAWLLQALSNGYFLLFFPVLLAMWMAWFVRWKPDLRAGLALAGTFCLSSLLLLPAVLKYREVHHSLGLRRQVGEMVHFAAEPVGLFRIPSLLTFWPHVPARTQEGFLFPGLTVVVLALLGCLLALRWTGLRTAVSRRSPLLFYMAATLLMWWLALGPAPDGAHRRAVVLPYTWLAELPGFSGLRAPSRFGMLATLTLAIASALAFHRVAARRPRWTGRIAGVVLVGLILDGWIDSVPLVAGAPRVEFPQAHDPLVLELPLEHVVSTTAMFRMITHRRPLVGGYSGHTPPHVRILAGSLQRDDPSALFALQQGHPLVVVVNDRYDEGGATAKFVASLPHAQRFGGSAAGPVFLLPPQPRLFPPVAGARLEPVSVSAEDRDFVVYDLGRTHAVRTIAFPVRDRFHLLHPKIEVETSLDRQRWTSVWLGWTGGPAAIGALENPREIPLRINLPDVETRYLRIHPIQAWIVGELSIHAPDSGLGIRD